MPELGDYLNSINFTKKSLMEDFNTSEENEKAYLPFIINRLLSNFSDSIFHANQMNEYSFLDNKMQYDYFLFELRPRKRFSKFMKPEAIENLEIVKEYFGYNIIKAKEALGILTPEQLEIIKKKMYKGGRKK
jgi:hypothetical protein